MRKNIDQLPTPSVLIERKQLQKNTSRMAAKAHRLEVQLRPHVKTHKTIEGTRYQVADHFGGITVSTLAEAQFYAAAGFSDITYAVPISPGKIPAIIQLNKQVHSLHLLLSHLSVAQQLAAAASKAQQVISLFIKIDCGYGRAGLTPNDPSLLSLGAFIDQHPHLKLQGILAHGGHSYDCMNAKEIAKVAEQERDETVLAANLLRNHGISFPTVSIGSTPTCSVVDDLTGITEIRPGNYALFDLYQAQIGSCTINDIAISVLTEIIDIYPERQTILTDAGALALSKDPGATHINKFQGYGLVCTKELQEIPSAVLHSLSQEHGKIKVPKDFPFCSYPIGTKLRIIPHHSCLVTALYNELYIVEQEEVVDLWRPIRGWSPVT